VSRERVAIRLPIRSSGGIVAVGGIQSSQAIGTPGWRTQVHDDLRDQSEGDGLDPESEEERAEQQRRPVGYAHAADALHQQNCEQDCPDAPKQQSIKPKNRSGRSVNRARK